VSEPRRLELTHVFDASREEVFDAWTDPDQVAVWFAPEGLEIPRESVVIEARVGGRFHLTMVDPAGRATHDLRAEIVEISPPELLVLRSEPIPEAGIMEATISRVAFEAEGERTRMTITDGPYTDEVRRDSEAGWRSVIENLDGLLRSRS
jgi:uncharacterized protein YndB with AHSA1/START domain